MSGVSFSTGFLAFQQNWQSLMASIWVAFHFDICEMSRSINVKTCSFLESLVHVECETLSVSFQTFSLWCKEVRDGFSINNFVALPTISCLQTRFGKLILDLCLIAATVFAALTTVCSLRR